MCTRSQINIHIRLIWKHIVLVQIHSQWSHWKGAACHSVRWPSHFRNYKSKKIINSPGEANFVSVINLFLEVNQFHSRCMQFQGDMRTNSSREIKYMGTIRFHVQISGTSLWRGSTSLCVNKPGEQIQPLHSAHPNVPFHSHYQTR